MKSKLTNKQQGFTIIEVMIVLAIAGLIMLIVFLAVPALQRNSRNTQRSNDASRTVAAINECATNHNGQLDSCNDANELSAYITLGQNQQLTALGTAGVNSMSYQLNTQCTPAGTGTQPGGGTRALTITYQAETSGGTQLRCISG
jgi:prepilin-type N-terminal cleavage/methylation domain-containing protein